MMRRGAAAALTVLAVTLAASWAAPRLSARAAGWLESVPVRGKTDCSGRGYLDTKVSYAATP